MRTLRVAVIGCGRHMQGTLAAYLVRLSHLQFEVCVDLEDERTRAVQHILRARTCVQGIRDLDSMDLDAAVIALPPDSAADFTHYCLSRGIHCFVEKPPAQNTHEIKEILAHQVRVSGSVQIGFNFRFADTFVQMQQQIRANQDYPVFVSLAFRSVHPCAPEWGVEDTLTAWLRHNGIHAIDVVRWLAGEIISVYTRVVYRTDNRFLMLVLVQHQSAATSILRLGNLTQTFDFQVELGTLEGDQYYVPHLGELVEQFAKGVASGRTIHRARNLDDGWGRAGYGPELQEFFRCCRDLGPPSPSVIDALRASQVCDAILGSLQTGAPTAVRG